MQILQEPMGPSKKVEADKLDPKYHQLKAQFLNGGRHSAFCRKCHRSVSSSIAARMPTLMSP
jgi:hypothetical protein